jgi:hypothetical protein
MLLIMLKQFQVENVIKVNLQQRIAENLISQKVKR